VNETHIYIIIRHDTKEELNVEWLKSWVISLIWHTQPEKKWKGRN